jgi:hypothetical protein
MNTVLAHTSDHYFGMLPGVRGFSDPAAITLPDGKPAWYQPVLLHQDHHVLDVAEPTRAARRPRRERLADVPRQEFGGEGRGGRCPRAG